eukprot:3602506-Prymnesium_polylepis.1
MATLLVGLIGTASSLDDGVAADPALAGSVADLDHGIAEPSRIATFALVRGGQREDAFDSFVSSRSCLLQVMPSGLSHDDILFHETSTVAADM